MNIRKSLVAIFFSGVLLVSSSCVSLATDIPKDKNNQVVMIGSTSETESDTKKIPVLMYHHLVDEDPSNASTVSVMKFKRDMEYLVRQGYSFITAEELAEGKIPSGKVVMITFDDGYRSNYFKAFPILKEYNIKATISLIGYDIGKVLVDGVEQIPKLSKKQIKEMHTSGLVDFQSHSWNSHYIDGHTFSGVKIGKGILKMAGESTPEYIERTRKDILLNHYYIASLTDGDYPEFFCYPYGLYNQEFDDLLKDLGYVGTLTTSRGVNKIKSGDSLMHLKRYNVSEKDSLASILKGK